MSKTKRHDEDDFEYDLEGYGKDDGDDTSAKDDYSYLSDNLDNEKKIDSEVLAKIFGPSKVLRDMEMTWRGFIVSKGKWVMPSDPNPIARSEFINLIINGLRSIANESSMMSAMSEAEAEFVLKEKNKEFIFLLLEEDEESVSDDHVEIMANMYDHFLEFFMGFVVGGHGSKILRQIHASLYHEMEMKQKNPGGFGLSYNDTDLIRIGGNKNG